MGIKLLFLNLFLFAILLPTSGMAQECPSSVSISSDAGTTICEGTNVTFTATPTNGTNINYEWFIENVSSGTGASISTTTLTNNDKVKVVAKSTDNTACATTSNILTITVNTVRVPSVSISASATTICPGENIQFTAAPINGGNSPAYNWKVDGSSVQNGSSNTFSSTSLINGQFVTVELTSNATCASPATANSSPINITVKAGIPAIPGAITGNAQVCPGISSLTYTIAAVTNATSYEWTLPSGWSGTSTSNSISATSGATGSGTITVKAKNDCGISAAQTFAVIVLDGTPNTPGTITGTANLCPGANETFSITAVSGATTYNWTVPTGWSIASGAGTNSITVTSGNAGQNGNVSVTAGNSCGMSAAKTLGVTVKAGTPAAPTTLSGAAAICPTLSETYSIPAVAGATQYIWTLPSGFSAPNLTTTNPSIIVTAGASGSGNITVKASNDCGISAATNISVSISDPAPVMTGTITQPTNGVCANTTGHVYSIPSITNATSYIWSVPNNWTITAGSATRSITVTSGSSGGNISVIAKNNCGESSAKTIAVVLNNPPPVMTGVITGPPKVCSTATGLVYSIPAITNATEYIWTLPTGWSITGGQNTRSITVSAGATSPSNNTISVIAKNFCGSSQPLTFNVSASTTVPAKPGDISTDLTTAVICPPINGIKFWVPEVSGMTYNWILPTGFQITSGAGTNQITLNITTTAAFGNNIKVEVEAVNSCGPSIRSSYSNINLDKFVITNLGEDRTVCSSSSTLSLSGNIAFGTGNTKLKIASITSTGTNQVSGFPNGPVNDFPYQYNPSPQDLATGKVTFTIITEKPAGACAAGTDEMTVFFKPDPIASISGTTNICTGNSTDIIFNATPNTVVTYKKNSGTDQTIAIGASGTATLNTGALTANTTYSLVSIKYTTAPDCPKTITGSAVITITAKPTANISYGLSPYNKCSSTGQPSTLSGTGAYTNGIYSAPAGLTINTTTGAITPSTSTAGTYTVTYETLASGGCEKVSTTTQVVIEAIPTISLSYAGTPFCSDNSTSPLPTLGGTGKYQGGSYSAQTGLVINSTSGAINIAASTPGSYNVTYSITPATGCTPVTQITPVVITEKPQPSISYSATEFCRSLSNVQPASLTQSGTAVITGGTYSSLPSGLSIDATSGAINPSLSDAGDYTIKYTLAATNGCEAVFTETTVSITEIPSAEISYAGPFCQSTSSSESVTFTNTVGAYQTGIFSATGGLTINASTGAITPNQSGTHTVTYKIPASGGCAEVIISTEVIITKVPAATITYNGPFCSSETNPQAVSYSNTAGAYQNGEFSGTNGLSIAADGSINPSTSTQGIHTVTYKILSANGCEDVISTTDIEIFEQVAISTQPSNLGICSTQAASFEVVASGDNLSYEWKRTDGAAITNATGENTSKLSFSNATSTNAGEYYVEVYGNAACSYIATSETVTLNIDENIIIIEPDEDEVFCDQEKENVTFEFIAHANGAPLEFTWLKDGVELNLISGKHDASVSNPVSPEVNYTGTLKIDNPNPNDNGVYAVRIKGPSYFTCSDAISKTYTLNVSPLPDDPDTAGEIFYCQEETAVELAATGESGATFKWYGSEDGEDLITDLIPNTDIAGTTSFWVSQTTTDCESNRTELKITVKEKPAVPTTSTNLSYCLNEVATQLEAVGNSGNTINWYDTEDSTSPFAEAPTPVTSADVTTNYWVSQTKDGCESDRVQITITVNPLPILTAEATEATICSGSSTTLNATGATTYLWTINGTAIEPTAESTKASPTISPTTTTTYLVTGTSDKGCTSTAEVTITVDEPTVAGTLTGPASVCISSPNGDLSISDYTGDVVRWERSTDGVNWTSIQQTTASLNFTGLSETTTFRSFIKNGVCNEIATNEVTVTIDPLPMGGELSFAGAGRVFTICENPVGNYAVDLNLTGIQGEIAGWYFRAWDATGYTALNIDGEIFTGSTLSAAQIQGMNLNKTTVFQVEVSSGVCSPNSLSKTAIISVIPSDITPTPVTVEPGVVCLGEEVTLNSETGYENGGTFLDEGAFDNASITNKGWRIRRNNISTDLGFDTDANNTVFDRWKRATPRNFTTASINPNYTTGGVLFDTGIEDGNKGFALVSGNNSSTMETPVFTIGSMDQALLTFDQAYVLTPGASLKVEISTDGGNTYTTLYLREVPTTATIGIASGNTTSFGTGTIDSHPENKIEIDLGDYIGRPNLRIRFNYTGARSGDIWAVDNIDIPEGPNGITMEWRDYTDPAFPDGILIGTNNSEKYTPTEIGLNIFEVKTKLVYNSNGDACEVAENAQRIEVFAFDTYTSTATATGGVCGDSNIVLNGEISSIKQGVINTFPTLDGYETGAWEVEGPSGYTLSEDHFTSVNGISPATKDPNAIFNPGVSGNYSLTWTMVPTAKDTAGNLYTNPGCPQVYTPVTFEIEDCTTLDFDGVDDYVDLGTSYAGNNSVEAWVRPEATTGTIFSTPNFEITMSDLTGVVPNGRWYHIAVSNGILYVDGIQIGPAGIGKGGSKTLIGSRWSDTKGGPENYFSGWIEELRIWNKAITQEQIQFMMNQHLQNAANMGVEIPMPVPDGLAYSDLAGYYRLISKNPDPTNIVSFEASLMPANGITPDLAINSVPGKLNNMTTNQENTAPLPYLSNQDGAWTDNNTWLRPTVWDIPNSLNESEPIIWNIVRTFNDISSGSKDITVLGLKSETLNKTLSIADPNGAQDETNAGQFLRVTHYLKLDGNIDLVGESQLIQGPESILEETSKGWLERDQQGTLSSFNYNYWTAPVSLQGAGNNSGFTVGGIMWDGTDSKNPKTIDYFPDHAAADGDKTNPIIKSNYWLFKFDNRTADDYDSWQHIGSTGFLKTGEGHTMKGVAGTGGIANIIKTQNYVYRGKPNNGDITLTIDKERNYLVGNPYPSAIDSEKFILDNINKSGGFNTNNVFDGTIYLWDHFSGATHILREYVGGYAVLNLFGEGVPAIATDDRINSTGGISTKTPQRFIPVSQGFFVNSGKLVNEDGVVIFTPDGGNIIFKNSQRIFERESSGSSIFLKPETVTKTGKEEANIIVPKIRISFKSPKGYLRQLLVGAHPSTTNGFDLGYDAPMIEYNTEDMYWLQGGNDLVIQGVPDFGKDQILPLGIRIDQTGDFTIKIDKLENISDSHTIYLKDKVLDTIHDLRAGSYKSSSEPGEITDRFQLIFFKEKSTPDPDPIEGDPVVEVPEIDPIIVDDLTEISLLHSYTENEMMVLNPKELEISAIYLFDMNGKLLSVFNEVPTEKEIRLKVNNFSNGTYILKMHTEDQIINRKIIIRE